MRKLYPSYPPMRETDRFKFGKYRGLALWQVMRDDPGYVAFLVRSLPGFRLDEQAQAQLEARRQFGL